MDLTGKKIAIVVDQLYQEMEVWYPYYRFIEAGAEVHFVGAERGKAYTSKLGYPAVTHKSYAEVSADQYDGIVCPGGFAPDYIRRYAVANKFIADFDKQGKLVCAICHGPWCCVSAGILKGRRCTSFFAIKDDVVNAGGVWEDSPVVVDGNLVTSRRPDDLPAFMQASIKVVAAQK